MTTPLEKNLIPGCPISVLIPVAIRFLLTPDPEIVIVPVDGMGMFSQPRWTDLLERTKGPHQKGRLPEQREGL